MEFLEHPHYSLNLVPTNFYKFGPLDDAIRRVHGSKEEEIKNAVHAWSRTKAIRFSSIITKSVELWTKCIEKGGEYVEKLHFILLFNFLRI